MRKLVFFVSVMAFVLSGNALAMDIAAPSEYGRVVISNYSEDKGFAPVVFDHWLHRSMFTCRLCHVDIGFAMEANATMITADGNIKGFYCGSCHNGKTVINGKTVFAACALTFTDAESKRCDRCHSQGREVKKEHEFETLTEKLPKKGLGNRVDWEEAEATGLIKPIDYIEGISIKRAHLEAQKDFSIESKGSWMPDVIFSHKKHAVWNGCEVCHPDIFPSVEKGSVKYSMFEIYDGMYCGVCHNKVAFPLIECQRCHINPVQ